MFNILVEIAMIAGGIGLVVGLISQSSVSASLDSMTGTLRANAIDRVYSNCEP